MLKGIPILLSYSDSEHKGIWVNLFAPVYRLYCDWFGNENKDDRTDKPWPKLYTDISRSHDTWFHGTKKLEITTAAEYALIGSIFTFQQASHLTNMITDKKHRFSWFFVNFETQRVFMRMKIHCYWSLGSISWYFFSKMWHVIFVRAIPHESFQSDGSSWCGVLTSRLVAFRVRKQRSWSVVKVCLHILFPCPYLCPSPSRLHCW